MNLYTADLMATDQMHDRARAFATHRLAVLARVARPAPKGGWRERIGRAASSFRAMPRGTAA